MPSATPISMESTVSSSVPRRPASTAGVNIAPRWPGPTLTKMNFHWKWSFVMSMWMNIAASTMITTAPTQRHGCRTGTALIGSDRARSVVESVM